MIGTFWSMCRACPSVPVDKLHSEYRSTYRWHEYTGPRHEIIRRSPQGSIPGAIREPAFHRRKKHPELAYRTHKILSDSGSETLLDKSFFYDRARSEERWASSHEKNSRRSKSEGPPTGKSSYRLISTKPINTPNRSSTKNKDSFFNDENEAPQSFPAYGYRNQIIQNEPLRNSPTKATEKTQFSHSPISNVLNSKANEIFSPNPPKKSFSMIGIKNKESNSLDTAPVHKKVTNKFDGDVLKTKANPDLDNNNIEDTLPRNDDIDGEFKSEYKKNFQPFNRYDYDESKGVFEKRVTPVTAYNNQSKIDSPSSWYKEVVLLRQKANQYRHRGWGTELVPDHIAQLYNDQMMVWEQVSRRSTLSALSLASSVISRDSSPSKEEKENKKSPMKSLSRARSAKASNTTAIHQGKSERKPIAQTKAVGPKIQHGLSPKKGNKDQKKLGIKRTSPDRTSRESAVETPPTIHKPLIQGSEKPKRRPRPTSLNTTVPSGSKTAQLKKKEKPDGEVEDFPTIDSEQIVKSPPEPTRVKSPEQIVIRSPEPVNWTVPLDTGKTFTVTQNIREGDLAPRSYSEVRAWTPNSAPPPPASISAPTQLIELTKANIPGEILTK